MFGFFKKPVPDEAKIQSFCAWFLENNERIIASVENSKTDRSAMLKTLDEVEAQLAIVYRDGYQGNIEFEYGFNNTIGKWDLNLFHLNNRFLISATARICDVINLRLGDKWSANTAK